MNQTVPDNVMNDAKDPFPKLTVLLVSSFGEDHDRLDEILRHSNWQRYEARSQREALAFWEACPTPVVICEAALPDGTWNDLYGRLLAMQRPPAFIVTSWLADDRLWAEALNLGAYNVLAKPLQAQEVFHVVSLGWRLWKNQAEQPVPHAQTAA